jgi:Flp pilus assembly protein TadB
MISALITGALVGLGAWCVAVGCRLRRPSLAALITNLDGVAPARSGRAWLDDFAAALPLTPRPAADANLRLLRRDPASWASERLIVGVLAAAAGLLWAAVVGSALGLPVWLRLGFVLALAGAGTALPIVTLRSQADARRAELRVALGAYLDLVAVALSAGAGVEEAMADAATIGTGTGFDEISDALTAARRAGQPPWVPLGQLAHHLDIGELRDLAATLSLVGTEGARARETLLARARGLRRDQIAASEAAAARRTEAASIPVGLQFVGFLILIVYPALLRVAHGLS